MSASVLVVGGAGYIGSHMVLALQRAGYRVSSLDNLEKGHRDAVLHGELLEADLRNPAALEACLRRVSCDVVMHFAAYTDTRESVLDPGRYYENNVVGTLNLLKAMQSRGIARLVFSSSCAVYEPTIEPLSEQQPTNPVNSYGSTKLAVERALVDFAAGGLLDSVSLRYFNAAGADRTGLLTERHDPETHLIPLVLREAERKMRNVDTADVRLEVFGDDFETRDGTCVRDYVHVEEICAAHLRACERLLEHPGLGAESYNVGSECGSSVREVIETASSVTGVDIPYRVGPRRPGDPASLVAASARARDVLGWRPTVTSLGEIIESAWAAMKRAGQPGE